MWSGWWRLCIRGCWKDGEAICEWSTRQNLRPAFQQAGNSVLLLAACFQLVSPLLKIGFVRKSGIGGDGWDLSQRSWLACITLHTLAYSCIPLYTHQYTSLLLHDWSVESLHTCALLHTLAYSCNILLYTTVYYYILLYTTIYYCILLYTHQYISLLLHDWSVENRNNVG